MYRKLRMREKKVNKMATLYDCWEPPKRGEPCKLLVVVGQRLIDLGIFFEVLEQKKSSSRVVIVEKRTKGPERKERRSLC